MSETKKVLIVDEMHGSINSMLEEIGLIPDYQPGLKQEEILPIIQDYTGLIFRGKVKVDAKLIDAASSLKFVARAGAGMDKVDVDYMEAKGVTAINAPEGNRDALGEHALGMLLSLLHKINSADREVRKWIWRREENRGLELGKKVVGIYGFGNMGEAFAQKLSGLGCTILAYDKFKTGFSNEFVQEVDLETLRTETEVLSLHVPLKEDTMFLFDRSELEKYPKLLILINTARGKVLRLKDALGLLKEGELQGLALDVLENEKIDSLSAEEKQVFEDLIKMENVIITPHIGGWTHESYERINIVLVKKIKKLSI